MAGKVQGVEPLRLVLVPGAGVVGQDAGEGGALLRRERLRRAGGVAHPEGGPGVRGKATAGLRLAVGIGNVGFDVKDGSAVHQVRAAHLQHQALRPLLHRQQLHAAEPQGIGPEGRAGGKDAHAGVAPQPGRPHRRRPVPPQVLRKLPDEPQVGKALDAPQGLRLAVLRLENHIALQFFHHPGLPGDAELAGKIAAHMGDGADQMFGHSKVSRTFRAFMAI